MPNLPFIKQFPSFVALFCAFSVYACSSPEAENADLLLLNVQIIDIAGGEVSADQLIGIRADTIVFVDKMSNSEAYSGTTTIELNGKYVMPALWDNHVHFRGGEEMIAENKALLPLYLAHGITTVRDAGGDITASVLEWRDNILAGQLNGPMIFSSGPKLDGSEPAWDGSLKVVSEEDITAALDSLEAIGVDYVKMYDGNLTKEAFYGIIKAAKKRGLSSTGHMPMSANLLEAVDYGLDGSEHLYYVLKACSPKADSLDQLNLGYGMITPLIDTYDPVLADEVFDKLASAEVYITPTLYISSVLANVLDVDHQQDSLLQYMGPQIQESYQGRVEGAKRARASGNNMRDKTEKQFTSMVLPMYEAGVLLLAGSDGGAFNSYVYPGASLLGELQEMVKAGLSPQQALSTSLIHGPQFFGLEAFYGSIEKGKVADIIVLKNNPLEDIHHLNTLEITIAKGKHYDKATLQKLMDESSKQ